MQAVAGVSQRHVAGGQGLLPSKSKAHLLKLHRVEQSAGCSTSGRGPTHVAAEPGGGV